MTVGTTAAATEEQIESHVRAFLQQSAPLVAQAIAEMPRTARLWDVVDSLSLLDLVAYLEQTFQFTLDALELIPDNFETIESITSLVYEHLSR